MFDKVIVGVDGREGGRDAIELARRLATPSAAVTFAHIYGVPATAGRAGALALPLELEAAERLLRQETGRAKLPAETTAIYESSVARGLHDVCQECNADLLVVGSCHRGTLGRTLLGDDTSGALGGASCAFAIAPRSYAASAPASLHLARIGVGCDRSPESAWAFEVARALAAGHRSTIRVLSVVSVQDIPYGEPVPEQWPKIARLLLADERGRLGDVGGIDGEVTYGDPGEELAAFSAELDVLIVGSRSYGPVGRLLAGSTSHYLARHARCPLLVLPRSAGRATPREAAHSSPAEALRARSTPV